MKTNTAPVLGLIVRSVSYQKRSARSELDIALVVAALEIPVRLYFLGSSVLQLVEKRTLSDAQLPAGYRAWASLPELTDVAVFAEPQWQKKLQENQLDTVLETCPMTLPLMRSDWQACSRTIIL